MLIQSEALSQLVFADKGIGLHMIVKEIAVIWILLYIVKGGQAPLPSAIRYKFKDNFLLIIHIELIVKHAVRLIDLARQLDFPGRACEISTNLHVSVVTLVLRLWNIV